MAVPLHFKTLLAITIGISQLWTAVGVDFCNFKLCEGKKHIACNNSGAFSSYCGTARVMPLSASDRQAITKKHNTFRNRVALGNLARFKSARRMATMTWDDELAKLALFNVKRCKMEHDACRKTYAFPKAGQNLSKSSLGGKPISYISLAMQQIQQWFDEQKFASMKNITTLLSTPSFEKIGHFTASVQEKSNRIGCGIVRDTKSGITTQYLACNYAFTNVIGKPVYRTGVPISGCNTGKNKNFPGLCSTNEKYAYLYNS